MGQRYGHERVVLARRVDLHPERAGSLAEVWWLGAKDTRIPRSSVFAAGTRFQDAISIRRRQVQFLAQSYRS